jgi:DNA-binding Xre family transcriptional regulator
MIKNEKQKIKSLELVEDIERKIKNSNKESEILSLNIIKSEINNEINEYNDIKNGKKKFFNFDSLQSISELLINARIARKLSQKELAQIVGVSQQQIHRWENTDYETTSFWRLLDISEALELKININASLDNEKNHYQENKTQFIEENTFLLGIHEEIEKFFYFVNNELIDINIEKPKTINVIENSIDSFKLIYSDPISTLPSETITYQTNTYN